MTQEQIQRLEYALEKLRQTSTKAEFATQAPVIIEHIRRMRAEIDVYLGVMEDTRPARCSPLRGGLENLTEKGLQPVEASGL